MAMETTARTQHCETLQGTTHKLTVTNPTSQTLTIRTCNKYNPISGAPCVGNPLKPNHYIDCPASLAPGASTEIAFNSDTQYIAFTADKTEIAELWPSSAGVWPSAFSITP